MQINKEWMILFVMGFVLGIITYISGGNTYLSGNGIFSKYFLSSFVAEYVVSSRYFCYIFLVRVIPFLSLMILGYSRFHRIIIDGGLIWVGLSNGMILSSAMTYRGYQGMILFLIAYFPQILFYVPAFFLMLVQGEIYRNQKWTLSKYVFLILTIGIGVVLESFVNPYFLSFCLKKM